MPKRGRGKDVARDILPEELDPYRDYVDDSLDYGEIFYSEISTGGEKNKAKRRLRRKENSKKRR